MINYLQVENLTKSYGDLVLFDNISFTIGEGQRIALIGRNGSGKTTLLNILAGKDTADSGTITPRRDLRIAYLEQNPEYAADLTVLEACFRSDNPALRAIAAYEQAVADPAQDGLQEAMSRMDALAAWDYEQRAKEILSRLKINDFDKKIGQLSGGQLKRVALAAVLISEADLLIHVVDISHPDFEEQIKVVENTLGELGCADKPSMIVFNKIDNYTWVEKEEDDLTPATKENITLDELKRTWMARLNENCLFISAREKENIDEFRNTLYTKVRELHVQKYPYNDFLYPMVEE